MTILTPGSSAFLCLRASVRDFLVSVRPCRHESAFRTSPQPAGTFIGKKSNASCYYRRPGPCVQIGFGGHSPPYKHPVSTSAVFAPARKS